MFPYNNYLIIVEKIFFVVGAFLYLIFALVIIKQMSSLSKNVQDKYNPLFVALSYIHLIGTIFLIFFTLTLL